MSNASDRLYFNARVFTSDKSNLHADAFAVVEGKIAWAGTLSDLPESLVTLPRTDLLGRRVLPGFVDSHMHAIKLAGNQRLISALPPVVNSIEDMVSEVRRVRAGGNTVCIRGWGVDEGKLMEHRSPNRRDLDRGVEDVPVIFARICGHINYVNSRALELAGIDRNTPDPEGGSIGRDENGEPDGILYERAIGLVACLIPDSTLEGILEDTMILSDLLVSQGVTTCSELGESMPYDYREVYSKAAERGFAPKVGFYYRWNNVAEEGLSFEPSEQDPDGQFRIAGVKLIGDGSVSGRTAWCDREYLGGGGCGMPVCTEQELVDAREYCRGHNLQMSVHAMGAKAIERAVNVSCAVEPWLRPVSSKKAPEGALKVPSVRIDHAAMPTRESEDKAAAAGACFVTQPIFMYAEIESYIMNLGMEWISECYPVADWLKKGVNVAFSTDSPATSWATPSDPVFCIKSAVTRKAYDGTDCGAAQKIDIETAIYLYTATSAASLGFDRTGMIKSGFAADFIVLDRDILTIPSDEIDKVKVLETYINGKKVFERNAAADTAKGI